MKSDKDEYRQGRKEQKALSLYLADTARDSYIGVKRLATARGVEAKRGFAGIHDTSR